MCGVAELRAMSMYGKQGGETRDLGGSDVDDMCHPAHNQNKKSALNSNVHTNTLLPDPSQLVINFVIIKRRRGAAFRRIRIQKIMKFLNNPMEPSSRSKSPFP